MPGPKCCHAWNFADASDRCYDDPVPEEINRRVIRHSSTVLMPYTQRGKENLLRERIPGERIFVTGNPIYEVLVHHSDGIDGSDGRSRLGLDSRAISWSQCIAQRQLTTRPVCAHW